MVAAHPGRWPVLPLELHQADEKGIESCAKRDAFEMAIAKSSQPQESGDFIPRPEEILAHYELLNFYEFPRRRAPKPGNVLNRGNFFSRAVLYVASSGRWSCISGWKSELLTHFLPSES